MNQAVLAGAAGFRGDEDPSQGHEGLDKRRELVALNRRNARIALAAAKKVKAPITRKDFGGAFAQDDDDPEDNPYYVAAMEGVKLVIDWLRPIIFRRTMNSTDSFGNPILALIPFARIDSLVRLTKAEKKEVKQIMKDMAAGK